MNMHHHPVFVKTAIVQCGISHEIWGASHLLHLEKNKGRHYAFFMQEQFVFGLTFKMIFSYEVIWK